MASSKTSKTARVMNLLSKNHAEPAPEQAQESVPAPEAAPTQDTPVAQASATPAPVHTAATPPLISSMQADSAISHQVMSALENALDEELRTESKKTPVAPAAPVPEPALESAPAPAPEPVPEPIPKPAPEPIPSKIEPLIPTAPVTRFQIDADTACVNVTELLVEEKANKYITMFGLCSCPRCVADVKAYALNQLAPKYVVMANREVSPRVTLYENRFSAAVTAQIIAACSIVMANPRHTLAQE